jgi:CheY-like chemotaxis protein
LDHATGLQQPKPTLLCIDDIPQGLAFRKLILQEKGCEVLTASDGPTGIELARQKAIGAIILDYRMPGMAGDEVAEILKRERPEFPKSGANSAVQELLSRLPFRGGSASASPNR